MGRRIDIDELVGAAEIAERLGVKRLQVVHDWRRRHAEFPRPVVAVSRTLVWYWPEVRRWAIQTGRLSGDEEVAVTGPRDNGAPNNDGVAMTA
ncbi:helix-turn-helix transcriptional regulator [Candidatus Poriferisodalis sp.]|uniref:helix-turn-helix transcriptional regulator n=1 Tax=Candidatus Poriferisodalis sp. TaxID=3101277 RepID=UPI003D1291D8